MWTWPDCVRRRGWDPSQKVAGPDEGQVDTMRLSILAQGWCKKPRVRPRGLRMWTWPGPLSQKVKTKTKTKTTTTTKEKQKAKTETNA